MRALAVPCLLAVLTACGGLQNEPLQTGTIRGRVEAVDPAVAFAALVDLPQVRANIQPDGTFQLGQVPVGEHELLVVISPRLVKRVLRVGVTPGGLVDLQTFSGDPGAAVTVRLLVPSHQRINNGTVSVEGFPLASRSVDDSGTATLAPIGAGCYTARAFLDGLGEATSDFCTDGSDTLTFELMLPTPDGSDDQEGCDRTGCQDGYECADNGNCY